MTEYTYNLIYSAPYDSFITGWINEVVMRRIICRSKEQELNKAIENFSKNETVVLFFDELPWMATPKSRLLTALEYYWNRYWSRNNNLKLIICGSSASWIIKKIINNTGGLHNRVTRKLIVKPFLLEETKQFLQALGCKLSEEKILELYLAVGGVQYYLVNINQNLSVKQNINQLCFNESGVLLNEFDQLFQSLFKGFFIEWSPN